VAKNRSGRVGEVPLRFNGNLIEMIDYSEAPVLEENQENNLPF